MGLRLERLTRSSALEYSNVPYIHMKEEKKKTRCALQESAKEYLVSLFQYPQSHAIYSTKCITANPFLS